MDDLQLVVDALARRTLIELVSMLAAVDTYAVDRAFSDLVDEALEQDAPTLPAALPSRAETAIEFHARMETLAAQLKALPIERADEWLALLAGELVEHSRSGAATKIVLEEVIRRRGNALPRLARFVNQRYPRRSIAAGIYDTPRLDAEHEAERLRRNEELAGRLPRAGTSTTTAAASTETLEV